MACLPFFFYFLKVVMKNAISDERETLRGMFIGREEYEIKHHALQEMIRESIQTSNDNNKLLRGVLIKLGGKINGFDFTEVSGR